LHTVCLDAVGNVYASHSLEWLYNLSI